MKNYSEMSDFEINKLIAHALGNAQVNQVYDEIGGSAVQFTIYKNSGLNREGMTTMRPTTITKDFCNNPADAWPIIVDNKISLTCHHSRGEWSAVFNTENICFHANNPLRAAMIVFLMMNENKL